MSRVSSVIHSVENTGEITCLWPLNAALIFRSIPRVDLIKWVSDVRTSVRPSTKSFSDSDEIWYVGRGR